MGFHADQKAARVLANAINFARLGQAALRGETVTPRAACRRPSSWCPPAAPPARTASRDLDRR